MKSFFINQIKWTGPLAAITFVLFLPYFMNEGLLFASDQISYRGWSFYFDALKNFEIPFWNPYQYGGIPTFDAMFGDGTYPLFILLGLLLPIEHLIATLFILHVFIAGASSYILIRKYFKLDPILCLFLATTYMLNTNFISHIYAGHTGKFYIMAWLPLALLFLLKCLSSHTRWYHLLGLSLSIFTFISTAHLQFTYMVLMGFFIIWVFKFYPLAKQKQLKKSLLSIGKFWIPILLGVAMGYVILHPPVEYNSEYSVRSGALRTTYEHATSWSLHPEEFFSMITVPQFTGLNNDYWGRNYFKLNSEYSGILIFFMGILGLIIFRGKWFWFWLTMSLLSVIYALGDHTPFFHLFYNFIPGVKNFRAPGMILFWFTISYIMMSATFLSLLAIPETREKFLTQNFIKKFLKIGLSVSGVFIIMAIFPSIIYDSWNSIFGSATFPNFKNQAAAISSFQSGAFKNAIVIGLGVYFLYKWLFSSYNPKPLGLGLIVIAAIDLLPVNYQFIKTFDPNQYYPQDPVIQQLKNESEDFRIFGMPKTYIPGLTQHNRIEITDGYADQEYNRYRNFRGEPHTQSPNFMQGLIDHQNGTVSGSKFLDMLNVKYLAFKTPNRGNIHLAKNISYMPREYVAYQWEYLSDSLVIARMKQADFDPRKNLILSENSSTKLISKATDSSLTFQSVTIKKKVQTNNTLDYIVNMPEDGIFITADVYFPHWNAWVNDKPAEVLIANYLFRGVYLKKGENTIKYKYQSSWLKKGLIVSLLSFFGLIIIVIIYRRFENKLQNE